MKPTKEQIMLDLITQARDFVERIEQLLNEVDSRITESNNQGVSL